MKCIIQRVSSASVSVNNSMISKIQSGVLILLGIESDDSQNDIQKIVKKIIELRIFPNEKGQFDQSLIDIKGEVLVVSQFTLMANVKKGRRPSFTSARTAATTGRRAELRCCVRRGQDLGHITCQIWLERKQNARGATRAPAKKQNLLLSPGHI